MREAHELRSRRISTPLALHKRCKAFSSRARREYLASPTNWRRPAGPSTPLNTPLSPKHSLRLIFMTTTAPCGPSRAVVALKIQKARRRKQPYIEDYRLVIIIRASSKLRCHGLCDTGEYVELRLLHAGGDAHRSLAQSLSGPVPVGVESSGNMLVVRAAAAEAGA